MKANYSKIVVLLDRSGSMESIKNSTIEGFNKFLQGQKEIEGKCDISLYQFDDKYDIIYENNDIQNAPKLTTQTFITRGCTALLDAIGRTINTLGQNLVKIKESERPEKVFFVIITDGLENASKEFTKDKIFDMITHQTEKYNWKFIFLAANQDAIATGMSYGINQGSSITYVANNIGTNNVYNAMNCVLSGARCASLSELQSYGFSSTDRQNCII